jgi:Ca2+/Na+ antiporter
MLHKPEDRVARLQDGLNATARIILLGLVMDAAYQVIVFRRFYPVEAVVIALVLAFLPYVLLRGIVLRVARKWLHNTTAHEIR